MPDLVRDRNVVLATVVAALGYFVDIFDLLLFGIVRKVSLTEVLGAKIAALTERVTAENPGLSADALSLKIMAATDKLLSTAGVHLANTLQMTGLVVGGVIWGVLADRFGRLKMLFGSILVYSIANILNAFINDIPAGSPLEFLGIVGLDSGYNQYAVLRFVAGVGLAGELGAGITLVSELVSRERRGFATTLVAAVGIMGAVTAFFVAEEVGWRNAYLIGGLLGLGLLFLRIGVVESGMFDRVKQAQGVGRGAFWMLLYPPKRGLRYLCVVLCAVPIWYCVGVLVYYCDRIGPAIGLPVTERPSPGAAIMWCYVGLAAGDLASGLLSQFLRSRRKALLFFHVLTALSVVGYFTVGARNLDSFYAMITFIGFATGYWAVFVATAAEQFGTNLRATAATTAPNVVRWSAAGSAMLWEAFEAMFGGADDPDAVWLGAAAVGLVVLPIAMISLLGLRESFGTSLDWVEDAQGREHPGHAVAANSR